MKQGKIALVAAAAAVVGGIVMGTTATAAPATQPTTKPSARASHHRLTKPWSDLKSLTPQQQDQIYKLHADAFAQQKQIEQKEHDDVAALLTPEQRKELADLEDKAAADRKEKLAETRRRRSDATTKPSK